MGFFLRFYGQTDHEVKKCIRELRAAKPSITTAKLVPSTASMNFHTRPSHTIELGFTSKAEEDSMTTDAVTKEIYLRYASPGQKATLHVRQPGQMAFNHT